MNMDQLRMKHQNHGRWQLMLERQLLRVQVTEHLMHLTMWLLAIKPPIISVIMTLRVKYPQLLKRVCRGNEKKKKYPSQKSLLQTRKGLSKAYLAAPPILISLKERNKMLLQQTIRHKRKKSNQKVRLNNQRELKIMIYLSHHLKRMTRDGQDTIDRLLNQWGNNKKKKSEQFIRTTWLVLQTLLLKWLMLKLI